MAKKQINLIKDIKPLLGRGLTEEENKKLEWLDSWEDETKEVMLNLFKAVHQAGISVGTSNATVEFHRFLKSQLEEETD